MNVDRTQVLSALQKANETRLRRSSVRKAISEIRDYDESRQMLATILEEPIPEYLGTLPVRELLGWVHKMQGHVAERLLMVVEMSLVIEAGSMSDRQRLELSRLLRGGNEALKAAEENQRIVRWARTRRTAA